jgi:hypothetical protein
MKEPVSYLGLVIAALSGVAIAGLVVVLLFVLTH